MFTQKDIATLRTALRELEKGISEDRYSHDVENRWSIHGSDGIFALADKLPAEMRPEQDITYIHSGHLVDIVDDALNRLEDAGALRHHMDMLGLRMTAVHKFLYDTEAEAKGAIRAISCYIEEEKE